MNNYLKLNLLDVLLVIVLYYIAQYAGTVFYLPVWLFNIDKEIILPLVSIGGYCIFFLLIYLIFQKNRNQVFRISYSLKGFKYFPLVILIFYSQIVITDFIIQFIPTTGRFFGKLYKMMNDNLLGGINEFPIAMFLLIVIIAPLFEEIVFRGLILKGMLNNNMKPAYAILISAVIFGGIHIFPWQVVGGFISGIILGIVFYKTGSLLTSTLLHLLNNLSGYLLYQAYGSLETPEIFSYESSYFSLLLAVGALIVCILLSWLYLWLLRKYKWNFY